ncbi:MAG: hypothetical protein Q8T03_11070 [Bacteroidota bacterium]|nr:hypothetical protein [Bacteroidota bacterium]
MTFFFGKRGDFNSLFNPFNFPKSNGHLTNNVSPVFESYLKQINDYNKSMGDIFQNTFKLNEFDWETVAEEYKNLHLNRLDSGKNIWNSFLNNYNKQLDFSVEASKKLFTDYSNMLNDALKRNKQFLNDTLKTQEQEKTAEKSKKELRKEISEVA